MMLLAATSPTGIKNAKSLQLAGNKYAKAS